MVVLYQHLDFAYTPSEIAEDVDSPEGTATTTLRRLHERGYVGRMAEGYYHGLADRDDLRRYPRSVAETEALFTTHPDNADAPVPAPGRDPDTETADETTLEAELNELETDLDS